MNVLVAGSGGWGTALAIVLLENGHQTTLWSYAADESAQLRTARANPLLPGVALPEALGLTSDVAAVRECDVMVLATPSFAVRETARKFAPHLKRGAVVVSVSKGIERATSLCMSQVIAQEISGANPIAALSGPSHAEEVGRGIPTACVSAAEQRDTAELVQELFMNERFRVYTSDDVIGVELAGALKNVIALAAGTCDGMGFGDNTKAMLMTRGLTEMARLGVRLGGRRETFAGLAGVGDLIVTCTSMHSRNRRAGILIGQGKTADEARAEVGAVVEGYYAAETAKALADQTGVEMPIAAAVYAVLYEGKPAKEAITELMRREKKHEIEESWL